MFLFHKEMKQYEMLQMLNSSTETVPGSKAKPHALPGEANIDVVVERCFSFASRTILGVMLLILCYMFASPFLFSLVSSDVAH